MDYAINQVQSLVDSVLQMCHLEGMDGFLDMISLEKTVDASMCLSLGSDGSDAKKFRPSAVKLYLTVPSLPTFLCRQPIPLPPKFLFTVSGTEIVWDVRKKVGKPGASIVISCTEEFLLLSREKGAAGPTMGSSSSEHLKLMYVPVSLDNVSAHHIERGTDFENLLEIHLSNTALLLVQVQAPDMLRRFLGYLNSAASKKHNVKTIRPAFWLVDRPKEEDSEMIRSPSSSTEELTATASRTEVKPHSTILQCLCYPFIKKGDDWEKMAKCELQILSDRDGEKPRIMLSIDATKLNIAGVEIQTQLTVKFGGDRDLTLLLQNVATKCIGLYLIRVKDSKKRDEVYQAIESIKHMLVASNLNNVNQHLVRDNIPDFIKKCRYLIPTNELYIHCMVNIKTYTSSSKALDLGLCQMSLKTLESPVGTFKTVEIMSVAADRSQKKVLESLITSDMLVQDCRTTTCAMIKILFASKAGIEYRLELVCDDGTAATSGVKDRIPMDSVMSQVAITYLTKDVTPYENAFCGLRDELVANPHVVGGGVPTASGMVRSASCILQEELSRPSSPAKMIGRAFQSSRNLSTGVTGKKLSGIASSNGAKIGGWVASQVRFFNELAQRTTATAVVVPVMNREKVVDLRQKKNQSPSPVDDELQRWHKYFKANALNDEKSFIFPPKNCPDDLLACWIFTPRAAKIIISSAGVYDERLFSVALRFLERAPLVPSF
ncbi:hypothetical protein BDR26DRAFT_856300 [Obelidium mucronatum]|nr:hypothetical protein BDR26DRAFT_856300 [Obelidium mucronatum]